jgi:hypothetical protein
MLDDDESGEACIELNCSRRQLKAASISHGSSGTIFRCSCGPLTAIDLSDLERTARRRGRVRLVFPDSEVIISHVTFERVEPGWVQLEGRVVEIPPPTERRVTQPHTH